MTLRALFERFRPVTRWQRALRDLLLVIAVMGGVHYYQSHDLPEGPAPALEGVLTDGRYVKVGPGGTAQLVVFWSVWCPVCKAEEGNIESVAVSWPVVSVAMQSGNADTVRKHLRERGLTQPALIDASGWLARDWNVRGVPTHFILDPAGNVRFRVVGYATTWGLKARLWWAEKFPA